MLDTSKLLGLRLTHNAVSHDAPTISAKIGTDPVAEPVISIQSSSSISAVSGNNFILNMVDSRTGGGAPVMYFLAPSHGDEIDDNVWANLSFGDGEVDTIGTRNGFDYDSTQLTIGTDLYKNANANALLGVFGSYHKIDSSVNNVANVNSKMDYYQLGVYGKTAFTSTVDLSVAASVGYASVDSNRGAAQGNTHGLGYTLGAEFSTDIAFEKVKNITFSPYASLQTATLGLREYSETGAGAQRVDSDSNSQLFSTLGVKAKGEATHFGMKAAPQVGIAYVHEWLDSPARSSSVALGGGPAAIATSPDTNDDYVRLDGSYALDARENMTTSLNYTGLYNNHVSDNLFGVSVRYTW